MISLYIISIQNGYKKPTMLTTKSTQGAALKTCSKVLKSGWGSSMVHQKEVNYRKSWSIHPHMWEFADVIVPITSDQAGDHQLGTFIHAEQSSLAIVHVTFSSSCIMPTNG